MIRKAQPLLIQTCTNLLSVGVAMLLFDLPAIGAVSASEPVIIERLRQEPSTLFDVGMKRLRRAALDAALRITAPTDRPTTSRVWYKPDTGTIEVRFDIYSRIHPVSKQTCWDVRARAIRETFSIGRTSNIVTISFDARIKRRLGQFFAHEVVDNVNEIISTGQRLAEITNLEVVFVNSPDVVAVNCRASLAHPSQK